ncbi:unnamed protein product [Clonostachys rhizophaga]|uniref:Mandelate racemase/muconate lactonizing enzyme C-terminal domain-containing protein n=1 Tax=Clonostachys rhizophaga TaxID=160324 RepID=A0A9N9YRX7_9HYPO|nr:unnamed protein product [Clonostachys rhizophaga]
MQITDITVFSYEAKYVHGQYSMSGGRVATGHPSIVVRIRTTDGVEGWAESAPLGSDYLPSSFTRELAAIKELGPHIIGQDPRSPAAIDEIMDKAMLGALHAKAVIDMACWDLLGKSSFSVIRIQEPEEAIAQVKEELGCGVTALQLKAGDNPMSDARRVKAVCEMVPGHVQVWADANAGWNLNQALLFARAIGQGVAVGLEQPCPTIFECAEVGRRTGLPIFCDEAVVTLADLFEAHAAGIAGVNIKPSRVGGLTKARTMRDAAVALGMTVVSDDTWGSALTASQNLVLATTTPSRSLRAVDLQCEWIEPLIADVPRLENDGKITASTLPGNGFSNVRMDLLGEPLFTVKQ